MYETKIIDINEIDLEKLKSFYEANEGSIQTNCDDEYQLIQSAFLFKAENKLTAEIKEIDGEVVGYTTGVVRDNAYHCTNVVTKQNKVFVLSSDSFYKVLKELNIKYIKGHVIYQTPMYEYMTHSLGREDLFKPETMPRNPNHDGTVVTLTLL